MLAYLCFFMRTMMVDATARLEGVFLDCDGSCMGFLPSSLGLHTLVARYS